MYSLSLISVILAWELLWTTVTASPATCYFPSGEIATGNVPCSNGTEFTNCCGSTDNCLANGLCLVNTDTDSVEFGRGGCTDISWASPNCFPHCTMQPAGVLMTNGAAVFECDTVGYSQTADYCCELGPYEKTSCCKTPSLRFVLGPGTPTGLQPIPGTNTTSTASAAQSSQTTLLKTQIQSAVTSSVTSSSSSTTRTSSTTSTTSTKTTDGQAAATSSKATSSTSPNVSPVNTGLSEVAKIAIGVTLPVGILLAILLGFLIWNNHRNNKKIQALQSNLQTHRTTFPFSEMNSPVDQYGMSSDQMAEIGFKKYGSRCEEPETRGPHYEYFKPRPPEMAMRPVYRHGLHELSPDSMPPTELDASPMRVVYPKTP